MTEHKTILGAKLAVMEDVPYLKKRSSANLNYTFAGESDLIAKLRPSMIQHGIGVSCENIRDQVAQEYSTAKGSRMLLRSGVFSFKFTHTSGQFETQEVFAEAADSGDKAGGKMQTMALKYALRQFFMIETGDDPDEVVAERDSLNAPIVLQATAEINKARTDEELDKLYARFMVAEKAGFDENQLARLERSLNIRRQAMKNPKMNGTK